MASRNQASRTTALLSRERGERRRWTHCVNFGTIRPGTPAVFVALRRVRRSSREVRWWLTGRGLDPDSDAGWDAERATTLSPMKKKTIGTDDLRVRFSVSAAPFDRFSRKPSRVGLSTVGKPVQRMSVDRRQGPLEQILHPITCAHPSARGNWQAASKARRWPSAGISNAACVSPACVIRTRRRLIAPLKQEGARRTISCDERSQHNLAFALPAGAFSMSATSSCPR